MKGLQQEPQLRGALPKHREMRDLASAYPSDDAGAPRLATVNQASIPQQFDPFSQGYEEQVDEQATEELPTLSITIEYLHASIPRRVYVPWFNGLTVSQAFKAARVKDTLFRHVGVHSFAKYIDRKKVRLDSVLALGDVLRLKSVGRPMS